VIVLGWEPGGGSGPRCSRNGLVVGETDGIPVIQQDVHKSYFFYDADDGSKLGQFVLPREQTLEENCTIHNYTVVPLKNQRKQPRYVLVAGNYQSGISVVDFSDPANAKEIAYADPDPLVPTQLGGDWSTYFYNGYIYESDLTRGLTIWRLRDRGVRLQEPAAPEPADTGVLAPPQLTTARIGSKRAAAAGRPPSFSLPSGAA